MDRFIGIDGAAGGDVAGDRNDRSILRLENERERAFMPVRPAMPMSSTPTRRNSQAACLRRFAIFAIVARLQPVALWIDPQD